MGRYQKEFKNIHRLPQIISTIQKKFKVHFLVKIWMTLQILEEFPYIHKRSSAYAWGNVYMCKMYHIKLLPFTGYEKSVNVSICFYSTLLLLSRSKIDNFQNLRHQPSFDVCEIKPATTLVFLISSSSVRFYKSQTSLW